MPKAIKEFRKAKHFPVYKWYEYIVPETNNKYIIYYYAENFNCIEAPKKGSFVEFWVGRNRYVLRWIAGAYKHSPKSPITLVRQIHVYSPHFFHRYKERMLNNDSLTSNDVACQYFSRNETAMPIEVNEEINKNIEEYGEGGTLGFIVRDGICYTQNELEGYFQSEEVSNFDRIDAIVIEYKTFVSNKMLYDNQIIELNKEYWTRLFQAFDAFDKDAKDGVLTLRLDP